MQKIISLYQRNYDGDRLVRDEVVPGAEWVLAGEGWPTRKFDGTCCLIRGGEFFRRHEVKPGSEAPAFFQPAGDLDPETGKIQGWVPVGEGPEDKWHRQAFERGCDHAGVAIRDGTYELCGPKVQGNPEHFEEHVLVRHGVMNLVQTFELSFRGIREYLATHDIEGIVWHHDDGRMVKIKGKDFGLKRVQPEPVQSAS